MDGQSDGQAMQPAIPSYPPTAFHRPFSQQQSQQQAQQLLRNSVNMPNVSTLVSKIKVNLISLSDHVPMKM